MTWRTWLHSLSSTDSEEAFGAPSTSTTSEVEAIVRHSLSVNDPAHALLKRLESLAASYVRLIDHAELARLGAPPITASDVEVNITPRRGSSTISVTIHTHSDVAAEVAKASLENALPDTSRARLHLEVSAREAPHCTIAISRVHPVEPDTTFAQQLASSPSPLSYALSPPLPPQHPSSFNPRYRNYIETHEGFILALSLVVIVPILAVFGCCVWRRCRRSQVLLDKKFDKAEEKSSDPVTTSSDESAQFEDYEIPPPRVPAPMPVPVAVNPAFLPVDAYHGVPPKRFDL